MKKALFLAALLVASLQGMAQATQTTAQPVVATNDNTGTKALGLNLAFGGLNNNLGIGAKYQHFVTNNVRLEGSFNYYFENKGISLWDVNANAHYVFNLGPKFAIYPLVGFSLATWGKEQRKPVDANTYELSTDHTVTFGANIGGGIQYFLSNNVFVNAEVRDQILSSNYAQMNLSVGIGAKF